MAVEDLFNALEVHEELDLSDPGLLQVDEGILRMYDVQESDGRLTFTPKEGVSRQALGGAMGTTAIQPWGCESGVSFPWSQGAAPTFSVESNLNFTVDYSRQGGLRYLGATGTVKSSVVVKPTITAAVEGKVTCGFVLGRIPLTFLGPLSFFFGGSLPLGVGFEPDMTASENAYLNAALLGLSREELETRLPDILSFAALGDFDDVPVRHYSSGMLARLGFGVAMHIDADVLLIDEVLAVGDGAFQRKCLHRIKTLQEQGRTLLIATHDMAMARELCDRALWIRAGELEADGPLAEVLEAYEGALSAGSA